ncbi:adhesion G protein-coupled receptor B2 [Trichonephila clavipes]|nr:adhesion G protein-coupled receptor B2 [Trichonephila clavipes]
MYRVRSINVCKHFSDFDKDRIVPYRACGLSYRSIVARVGRDPMTISRIWNGWFQEDNLVSLHFKYDFWHMTATAGSDVVQSGRPIFDEFFQHMWPYIGNNTANVVFQMAKRLWLIHIDQ